jgi:hypothetical protein
MGEMGKWMVLAGLGLAVVGAVVWTLGGMGFRGMPGDFHYQSERVRIYIPIATCITLSIMATAMLWLWRWFSGW